MELALRLGPESASYYAMNLSCALKPDMSQAKYACDLQSAWAKSATLRIES